MKGVREVRQIDPQTLHWRAKLGGREQEWDAFITAADRAPATPASHGQLRTGPTM
jgi:hypothetical protein